MQKFTLLIVVLFTTLCSVFSQSSSKPNIILIMADDLNDYVQGFDGHPQVQTPNIVSLEEEGYTFTNAYCSSPGCAPSRTSMLSGKDPMYTNIFNNEDYPSSFRAVFSEATDNAEVYSLPEVLKNNNYYTKGIGKIFHNEAEGDYQNGPIDDCLRPKSWNSYEDVASSDEFNNYLLSNYSVFPYAGWGKVPDSIESQLEDYVLTDSAIAFLSRIADGTADMCSDQFFLALGFHRPHTGRFIPEKYFLDFYMDDIYENPLNFPYNFPINANPYNGIVMPPQPAVKWGDYYALPEGGNARAYADNSDTEDKIADYISSLTPFPIVGAGLTMPVKTEILKEAERANMVGAYIASSKFIDAQIGRVLDELNSHPTLAANTIIIFISDHGYGLGEKMHYTKWTLWETDIRIPFVIMDPKRAGNKICTSTASLLDIFPTVLDMAGVDYPTFSDGSKYLDGQSLLPLLNNPGIQWESPALTIYEKNCALCTPDFSVRSERFHLIKYHTTDPGTTIYDSLGQPIQETELYEIGINRDIDPNEWNNLGYDPDYKPIINYLDEFFPDSAFYHQKAMTAIISSNPVPCLISHAAKIKLKSQLYNQIGKIVKGSFLPLYKFVWTNNLNSSEYIGMNYTFNMSSVPTAVFSSHKKILFYLHIYEISTGKLVAFDSKTFYLNTSDVPTATFSPSVTDLTVKINDYTLTGDYLSTSWDFGDGFITQDYLPANHTYASAGTYTIKNIVKYGNGCTEYFNRSITVNPFKVFDEENNLFIVYPNPASDKIELISNQFAGVCNILIYSVQGEKLYDSKMKFMGSALLDISKLSNGMYLIEMRDEQNTILSAQKFIKTTP